MRAPGKRSEQEAPPPGDDSNQIEVFFECVRAEVARYLDVVGAAGATLCSRHESPRLAEVIAHHQRLTQQFLDAQRLILRCRAEAEVKIADLSVGWSRPDPTDSLSMIGADLDERARDVERRQLRALLDRWWATENERCIADVDDAETNAAVRSLWTDVDDARSVVDPTVPGNVDRDDAVNLGESLRESALPDALRIALDDAEDGDLLSTLDSLLLDLGHVAPETIDDLAGPDDDSLLRLALGEMDVAPETPEPEEPSEDPPDVEDEAFDRFWTHIARGGGRGPLRRFFSVAMSAASVAGLATVVVAVLGR